jgi:thymidylate kinase
MARRIEERMLQRAPGTVLVLFKASPEVIAKRMKENPHTHQIVQEKDIEYVLQRFEEEFEASLIQKRIVLDTTSSTVAETLAEFVEKYEPYHTNADLLRIRQHQAAKRG